MSQTTILAAGREDGSPTIEVEFSSGDVIIRVTSLEVGPNLKVSKTGDEIKVRARALMPSFVSPQREELTGDIS